MTARLEALTVSFPPDDIGARPHASWNDTQVAPSSPHRTLPRDKNLRPVVVLLRDVVVVAIDDFFLEPKRGHEVGIVNRLDDRLHHQSTIRRRVALGPIDGEVLPPSGVATPCLNANVSWPACVGERH